jgi:pullulanase
MVETFSASGRLQSGAEYAVPAAPRHCAMRVIRGAAFVCSTLLAGPVLAAGADAALRADCDAPGFARTLLPAAQPAGEARAYWLDAGHLRWPGAADGGRVRLYASARGALRTEPGHRVSGADDAFELAPVQAPDAARTRRFAFTGPGPEWALAAADATRLKALLRGQLLLVREDARGHVLDATRIQSPGALDALYVQADGLDDLGVMPDADRTRWQLWAPTAQAVALCIYETGTSPAAEALPLRRDDATGAWSAQVSQGLSGSYYTYLVDVFVPGTGLVRNRVTDPYAISVTTDSLRTWIGTLDAAETKPDGWDAASRPQPLDAPTDMAIYELHVRDFSRDDPSVSEARRGKYLAFTETDSAGMQHLRALRAAGMTDIHLLPVFDIASVPEAGCVSPDVPDAAADAEAQQAAVAAVAANDCYNWGYDPFHFNAPEGSYASDAADGAVRIREFRAMVQALHAAGLRVGMDVVYNHTNSSGQHAKSVLDRIVPGYYHRLDATGKVEQSTCCDNTATEHRMMGKLMRDSAVLWARQYRIDSFRFDLMGHQPRAEMERLRREVDAAAGRPVQLIGEGWNFGEIADGKRFVQASQASLNGSGIGTFSDRARDAIRGGGPSDHGDALRVPGYVNGLGDGADREALLHAADLVRVGLAGTLRDYRMTDASGRQVTLAEVDYKGQPAGYASEPGEVVNYVENHDNQTLFDINVWKLPPDTAHEDRARVQLLALALNAFSQGIAYFHAGGELLRSKSLDRNSFDSGDGFNRLDWTARDNHFGTGLPPRADNAQDWDAMRPLLSDARIRPRPQDIAFVRDAFNDLLRIRASTTLLRLRSAGDINARLSFPNSGQDQNPLVMAGHVRGDGYPGAGFRELLYLVNVSPQAQTLTLPALAGKPYTLHPVQAAGSSADPRPRRDARHDPATGRFTVPARTAVVYVVP